MPNVEAMTVAADRRSASSGAATNRRFVGMVRAKLDADGHRDVAISRQWIDEDTPGNPFLLNVPVGSQLVVPLKVVDGPFQTGSVAKLAEHAAHFAAALVNLRKAERLLVKYAGDVRRAAAKAIADARAEGLDVLLADVGFKPTYAWHLTGQSWKEAAYHVLASVKVRHTSFYLQPETSEVYVEEPESFAEELRDILDEQRERQARLAELDAAGADLVVDGITLELLRTHVDDVEQALRDVWKRQHLSIPINHDGHETSLSLITSDGRVESGIKLREAYWNGQCLWFLDAAAERGLDLVGKTLAGRVSHPALARRIVVDIERQPAHSDSPDVYHLDRSERFLFDVDTGRIWPEAAALAA